jgi:saccharopine dehydrogenase-like NADP-dependent oxidoreductase
MNPTRILVLGAGELGTSVIRHLARRAAEHADASLTVLLRGSTINSGDSAKRREVYALRALGVHLLAGDVTATAAELAEVFHEFDIVICCTGFVGGKGTQLRIAHAVLAAGVKRYPLGNSASTTRSSGEAAPKRAGTSNSTSGTCCGRSPDTAWVIVSHRDVHQLSLSRRSVWSTSTTTSCMRWELGQHRRR